MSDPENAKSLRQRLFHHPLTRIVIGVVVCGAVMPGVSLALRPVLDPFGDTGRVLRWTLALASLFASYALLFRRYERRRLTELSLAGMAGESAFAFFAGAASISLSVLFLFLAGSFEVLGVDSPRVLLLPFAGLLAMAALEEVIFRGILFRISEEWLGTHLALSVSALLFGALHLRNENANLASVLSATFGGFLLALLFTLTKRLWAPIFFHTAWNWAQVMYGQRVSGFLDLPGFIRGRLHGPERLTGGAFGLENSGVTIAVVAAMTLAAYHLARTKGKLVRFARGPRMLDPAETPVASLSDRAAS